MHKCHNILQRQTHNVKLIRLDCRGDCCGGQLVTCTAATFSLLGELVRPQLASMLSVFSNKGVTTLVTLLLASGCSEMCTVLLAGSPGLPCCMVLPRDKPQLANTLSVFSKSGFMVLVTEPDDWPACSLSSKQQQL